MRYSLKAGNRVSVRHKRKENENSMSKIIQVRSEILTPETFEPDYGEVLYSKGPPDIDWPELLHWDKVGEPHLVSSGNLVFAILRMKRRPFEFEVIERHVKCSQAFIPIGGTASVFVLAPPTDPDDPDSLPDLNNLKAFILDGTMGINLAAGTWHHDPFPLGEYADFVLLHRVELGDDDLGKVNIKDKLGISFQVLM
jgi:ureidoglycolate lyase